MRAITTTIFLCLALTLNAQKSIQELFTESRTAYEQKDFRNYLELLRQIDDQRPNHPTVVYKLAGAYALNGRKSRSIQKLRQSILMDATTSFEEDPDFKNIIGYKGYDKLLELRENLGKEEVHDEVFRTVDVGLIHPESFVILDDGSLLLGSVREKKIVKVDPAGNVSDWLETEYAVLGMKLKNGFLWASTAAIPQMLGYEAQMKGTSVVLQVDPNTAEIVQGMGYDDQSTIGDIELDKESRIWLSNSMIPYISRDNTDTVSYRGSFVRKQYDLEYSHFNIQGVTLNEDESVLYFSDYISGIHKIDLATDNISKIFAPKESLLKGIDGLYSYKNSLIAIHNGVKPYRIIQYVLDEAGDNILLERVINRAGPTLGEPTLGMIKEGYFYYIANSPWIAYDQENQIVAEKVKPLEIRRIKLD